MKLKKLGISGLYLLKSNAAKDNRGFFLRHYCKKSLRKINFTVKQANISYNKKKGTLRGFHFQKKKISESKILSCLSGSIFNVTVDIRKKSSTYKKYIITSLNCKNQLSLVIPKGCANAFLTLENNTIVHYYMNDFYKKGSYGGFSYKDSSLNIKWPILPLIISKKDRSYKNFIFK